MSKPIVRGISVTTRCDSVAEFIERYADRVDADSIVVGSALDTSTSTLDRECAFAFLLSNKQPVLAGTGIAQKLPASSHPRMRDGFKLTIVRLGPSSRTVFEALHQMRSQREAPTHRRTAIAVAAIALVAIVMCAPRPRIATVHASAPTWLGMPMSAQLVTKPVEPVALTPKSCK